MILSLIFAVIPASYLLIVKLARVFSKRLYSLGETTAICTTIPGVLTRKNPVISLIHFDHHQLSANEENILDKKLISENSSVEFISAITSFCRYPKLEELENAILNFLKTCGVKNLEIKENYRVISEIPSNNDKKITTVVAIKKDDGDIFALSKGNSKKILERCTRMIIDNKKVDLTTEKRRIIKRKLEKITKRGQKLIAFAYKGLPKKILDSYGEEFVENDLIFLGFIGLNDQINMHLRAPIEKIREAKIKIYITSGLKEKKAVHAATELKVVNTSYFETINGSSVEDMDDRKLQKILSNRDKDFIFCEMNNHDKTRVIEQLELLGEKVTILNQKTTLSFEEILESVKTLKEKIKNDQRIKSHAISCKIAEAFVILCALIFGNPTPLSLALILILDLIVNLILELAIRENKSAENNISKSSVPSTGIFMSLTIITVYILNLLRFGWYPGEPLKMTSDAVIKSSTMIFILLILFQIIAAYMQIKRPFKNIYLGLSTIVCLLLIYTFTQIQFIQNLLNLSALGTIEWQIILFACILLIAFEEIRKYFNRHRKDENRITEI